MRVRWQSAMSALTVRPLLLISAVPVQALPRTALTVSWSLLWCSSRAGVARRPAPTTPTPTLPASPARPVLPTLTARCARLPIPAPAASVATTSSILPVLLVAPRNTSPWTGSVSHAPTTASPAQGPLLSAPVAKQDTTSTTPPLPPASTPVQPHSS